MRAFCKAGWMMSESFATNRALTGAEEFDRRRRSLAPQGDPLAELARLVGQDDPFRGLSPQIRPVTRLRDVPVEDMAAHDFAASDDGFGGAPDMGEEPGAPDDPAVVQTASHHAASAALREEADRRAALVLRGERAPDISSDAWARGGDSDIAPMPAAAVLTATRDQPPSAETRGGSQRTLIVLAAVVALTGGGLAASFLAKPAGGSAAAAIVAAPSAPTILADTGPMKVKPETQATDPDAPSEPSTLLDKNKNDGTATAKVVDTVEQPVDLSQAVKPAPVQQQTAEATAAASPFPEPRKVKTILVRPDGTVIADRPATAAVADAVPTNTISQQASLAFDPKTSLPIVGSAPPPVAAAAPPANMPIDAAPSAPVTQPTKSQARVPTTPRPATTEAAKVKPAAKPTAKPKPVEQADATPTAAADADAAPPSSGKFGVQLGAAASGAEAKDLSTRLGRKYAGDLDGGHPAVHKAQSGDKTVFRVRVGGLSQEAAKALCGKIAAGGGGCFVIRD